MSLTTLKADRAMSRQLMLAFALTALVIMLPDLASAATYGNSFEEVFCKIIGLFTGTTGKALATIGVTIIGIGALLGKVSWGMALIVGIGIAIVFGAVTLVNTLSSTASGTSFCP